MKYTITETRPMARIKCGIDPAIPDTDACAWCCVHCNKTDCEYRCPLAKTENEIHCEYYG